MKKVKITSNVSQNMKREIEVYAQSLDKSVSEFCGEAIGFYLAHLHNKNNENYINKVTVKAIESITELQADRISDMIFKLAVSIEKQNLISSNAYYDEEDLEIAAIQNVKMRHGRI